MKIIFHENEISKNQENEINNNFCTPTEITYSKSNIKSMTKGWQCCKCKETMYNDELNCTWNRCNHRRCSSCRSFQN